MRTPKYTYALHIDGRMPENIPMSRIGEYLRLIAEVFGQENHPIFKGIRRGSTNILAQIPAPRIPHTAHRVRQAITDPTSRQGRALRKLEQSLAADNIRSATLLRENGEVVHKLNIAAPPDTDQPRVFQAGTVDGVVTGILGADATMHVHIRDDFGRDVSLTAKNFAMIRRLLEHFRSGVVRLHVVGYWLRTEQGWLPEARSIVEKFDVLDVVPTSELFSSLLSIEGNGIASIEDPLSYWKDLRGIQ